MSIPWKIGGILWLEDNSPGKVNKDSVGYPERTILPHYRIVHDRSTWVVGTSYWLEFHELPDGFATLVRPTSFPNKLAAQRAAGRHWRAFKASQSTNSTR